MFLCKLLLTSAFLVIAVESQASWEPFHIAPVVIKPETILSSSCPAGNLLEVARSNITAAIQQLTPIGEVIGPYGRAGWTLVASLDMGDPSQQPPSRWQQGCPGMVMLPSTN